MGNRETKEKTQQLARSLEVELMEQYGPVLTGDALRKSLGYPSMGALRQAVLRGKVPVPIFQVEDRRGRFALTKDVAHWLAEMRNTAANAANMTIPEES